MKSVSRALLYLLNNKWTAAGAVLSMLFVNAANLATPQILRYLIDRGITPLNMTWVWYAVLGLFAVAVVRGVFNFLQGYWSEVSAQGVAFDLRNVIFAKLEHLSFSYHDSAQTGKLMTRMTSDVELVQMFVGRGSLMIVSALILLAGTVVVMLNMNWKLTLVLLVIIPLLLGIFAFFVRGITPISKEVQVKLSNLNTTLQENMAGARVVKAFAREAYELERFIQQNQELLDANLNMVRLFTSFFPLIFFIGNLATVGVVWFGGLQVIGESLSMGELVAFLGYVNFLLMPIFMIGMIGSMLGRAEASAQRIFEVIDTQSDVQNRADAILLPPIEGRVAFNDVSFRYFGSGENVLCKVSFTAEPGQVIAIMGKTGAGKSSIINLIPRFYDVTSGRVTIDSYDVRQVTLDSLRSQVGIVLQETTLFSGTIRDNIAYGRPEATLEEVMAAANAAQAHEFIMETPGGYDTEVGERGVGLSSGQKQRVAIARTLLVDPRILILDDSTSSVDAETEYKIQQALQQLMIGRTSFIIAQRISTVRNANLILLLDNGNLVAQGSHEELMRTSELYADILETQFGEHAELLAVVEEELVI